MNHMFLNVGPPKVPVSEAPFEPYLGSTLHPKP